MKFIFIFSILISSVITLRAAITTELDNDQVVPSLRVERSSSKSEESNESFDKKSQDSSEYLAPVVLKKATKKVLFYLHRNIVIFYIFFSEIF